MENNTMNLKCEAFLMRLVISKAVVVHLLLPQTTNTINLAPRLKA